MMHADATSYLPDDVLVKVDRATMAVGLEGHAPFLDHRVAEFAARLPLELKVRGGQGKRILRRLLEREIPPALVRRPKAGFSVPVGEWLRGPLRDWADSLLQPSRLDREGWFDPPPIAAAWNDHLRGMSDRSSALWPILMFESWLENDWSEAPAPR
jgi:asparagine synthase (glutamine-hydrolysing)